MRRRFYKLFTWVVLSGTKYVTQAWLITLEKQLDADSVGEVPLPRLQDRDDPRSTRVGVLFTMC
jgi:hypothetical protein